MNVCNLVQRYRRVIHLLSMLLLLLLQLATAHGQPVGEVNGSRIDADEFQIRLTDAIRSNRVNSSGRPVNEGLISESLFNQMIDELLIRQAAERLGISFSDERLMEILLNDPPEWLKDQFTDSTGTFRDEDYRRFMVDPRGMLTEVGIEEATIERTIHQLEQIRNYFRNECLRKAVDSAVSGSAAPSPAAAYASFMTQGLHAGGSIAIFYTHLIDDRQVPVTEDEAKNYFNTHRAEYQQPVTREAEFVIFPVEPTGRDSVAVTSELSIAKASLAGARRAEERDALFETWVTRHGSGIWDPTDRTSFEDIPLQVQKQLMKVKRGAILGPFWLDDGAHIVEVVDIDEQGETTVRAEHIQLPEPDDGNVDSVKALAKDLIRRIKGGERFNKLAEQFSHDPSVISNGGDLGYFGRHTMTEEFGDAAFKAKPGAIIGPIKTEYGYHIIRIIDRSTRSFTLRDWMVTPQITAETREGVRRRAQEFRQRMTPGTDIAELASHEDLEISSSGPIRRNQQAVGSLKLGTAIYAGTVGSLSEVIRLPDGNFAIAQVKSVHDMTYDDVRDQVMARLRTEKKLDMLKDRATTFRNSITPGANLMDHSSLDNRVNVQTFDDLSAEAALEATESDTALVEVIFTQKLGEPSQPIRGKQGYYIIQVDSRKASTERSTLQRPSPLFDEWLATEREKATIRDLRSER